MAVEWGAEIAVESVLGSPCRVYTKRPRQAGDILAEGRWRSNDLYLVQGERRLTFADHERQVSGVQAILRERGVRKGDRVMIYGVNSVEFVVAFWAILRSGAVAVLGNAWWSESELLSSLDLMTPRVVICDEKREKMIPDGFDILPYKSVLIPSVASLRLGDEPPTEVSEDGPAVVIFTSGTSGRAKAATLSHRALVSTLQCLLIVTGRLPKLTGDKLPGGISLLSLPLFHIGGLQQVTSAMATGGRLVFSEGRFDPATTVTLLRDERVRAWSAVPTMVSRVVDHLETNGGTVPELRTLGIGGSAVSEHLRERSRRTFPAARRGLGVTWGLTEAGGAVTTGVGVALEERPGCVGRIFPTAEVRVASPDDQGRGELLVRSPSVMLSYWGSGESPISADRWLSTGDIGWVDPDSYVYITDRAKDIIIRGGENVSAAHVEDEISRFASVEQVAVVGLPHADLGEEVAAIVKIAEGASVDLQELADFVRAGLAAFEVPSRWWVRKEPLPMNSTGKVLKGELKRDWNKRLESSELC